MIASEILKVGNSTVVEATSVLSIETTTGFDCDAVDPDLLYERFYMAVIGGGSIAIVSIFENLFLFLLFITSKQHRNSFNLYMLLVAFFDIFLSISYVALMAVRVLTNWTGSYALRRFLMSYMIQMLTISHVAQTASVYLITFATIERSLTTIARPIAVQPLQNNRKFLAFVAVMCGVLSKGTILFEIEIHQKAACVGHFNEFVVMPANIVRNAQYNTIWRIWFRNLFTIVFPFLVLFVLNLLLWGKLRLTSRRWKGSVMHGEKQNLRQNKARIRAATRSLAIIVLTYLLSNLLSVLITVWEMFDAASLWSPDFFNFYILSVDAISILPIICCSLRLPIYATCQPLLRAEMIHFLAQPLSTKKMSRRATIIETQHFGQSPALLASRQPTGELL